MNADIFIDSNILVYAHDLDGGTKHDKARQLLSEFWVQGRTPSLSIQVLQETHVNLVRRGVPLAQSVETVSRYLHWHIIENTRQLLARGFEQQQRFQLSFWDALIVAAAQQAGAGRLWSEDMNEGQAFGDVVVENPLSSR